VGIFAMGNPETAGWNGVTTPVTGLLYGGGAQILAQLSEMIAIAAVVFGLSLVFFRVLARFHVLRSRRADELAGLDVPEMGTPGYVWTELPAITGTRTLPQGMTAPAE